MKSSGDQDSQSRSKAERPGEEKASASTREVETKASTEPEPRPFAPVKVEIGSAEDRKRSKEIYLQQLEADKGTVRLEENPHRRKSNQPRGNLLKVFDDKPEQRGDGKRKRRKPRWQK